MINSGSIEVIKLMIERGEVTPRTRLQVSKHITHDIVIAILSRFVIFFVLFQRNRTLLMYATFRGSKVTVDYLLKLEGFNSLTETDEVH